MNETHDGYIYPCPMDRAVMRRWGVSPREFTTAISPKNHVRIAMIKSQASRSSDSTYIHRSYIGDPPAQEVLADRFVDIPK